jgi:DNA transformation protein
VSEFTDYLHEVFEPFGPIHCRRMFGGVGVYHEGLMFGLVADEVLYLKADADSRAAFAAEGLEPFRYVSGGKDVTMSYFRAPESVFEDPEQARDWARRAFAAALRGRKQPIGRKPRPAPTVALP